MKRLSVLGFFALITVGMVGCPVWDDGKPFDTSFGGSGEGGNGMPGCSAPDQCQGHNQVNQTCGDDGQCHIGDCTLWGCVDGYSCQVDQQGFASCVAGGDGGSGGRGGATGGGGAGGGGVAVVWCGNPADCAMGSTCAPNGQCAAGDCNADGCIFGYTCNTTTGACDAAKDACGGDADCAASGANFECIDGKCTAPANQCFDQNQCTDKKCAGGKCETGCAMDGDCPSSYTCNTTTGVCTDPAQVCMITNDCGTDGSEVCVDGACVPRAGGDGTCPAGTAWVENGCIPTQAATFTCTTDGTQDTCAAGSICVHHSCYISCEGGFTVCQSLPVFDQCQTISSSSGAYAVCGSPDSLGNDCDPTEGLECMGAQVCVDGVCK